jgi:hypothetical protein
MPTAARPAAARPNTFVVMHVRQALQHAVATGVCSAYLVAAWVTRPVQMSFTTGL